MHKESLFFFIYITMILILILIKTFLNDGNICWISPLIYANETFFWKILHCGNENQQ